MSIFHAYDIRGKFPEELNEKIAYKISRSFAVIFKSKTVVVGRDARLSSPVLHKAVIKGLIDQGVTVIDIGLCTTPMFYFGIAYYKNNSGIMISASLLPKEFNGLKFCKEKAIPISYEAGLNKIEKLIQKNNFKQTKKGKIIKKHILNDYTKFVLKKSRNTKLKIVVDAGNMMGAIDGKIISKVAKVKPLFFKIDGTFPNRGTDSSKEENLVRLKQEVMKQKADLGVAFDGDADRVSFVDEKSNTIRSSIVGSLILIDTVKSGSKVVHDLTISRSFIETASKLKVKTIISKVGHTYVGRTMRNNNAVFGVERSGHYFFKYNFYMDSGVYATIKLIELMNKKKQKISKIIESIKKYPSTLINLEVKEKDKAMSKISELFIKDAEKVLKIDGASIYHKDYWLNIRKSNTENVLRIVIEADTDEKLEEIKNKIVRSMENDIHFEYS